MSFYIEHFFLKKQQSEYLSTQKKKLKPNEIIIQADFAENYSIKHQSEIMECHWKGEDKGVVIFTACVYYKQNNDSEVQHRSYAVISDTDKSGTLEMAAFMDSILIDLNNNDIFFSDFVHFWTDGAARHFKNRYAMAYLSRFQDLYGAPADWNFHESYHGKGPMDGIGAVLKHHVFLNVLRGQAIVLNAFDFYTTAKTFVEKTVVLFRSKEIIMERQEEFLSIWRNASEARGILKARCVRVSGPYTVLLFRLSKDTSPVSTRELSAVCDDVTVAEDVTVADEVTVAEDVTVADDLTVADDVTLSADVTVADDTQQPGPSNAYTNTSTPEKRPSPGDFVLVELAYKKSNRYYVAQVLLVESDDMFDVKYLRKVGDNLFRYPEQADFDIVSGKSITLLPDPSPVRETTYLFKYDFPAATF